MTFRQKIFTSYLVIFLLLVLLLYPLLTHLIEKIQERNLYRRTEHIIEHLVSAPNMADLVQRLADKEKTLFFRAMLFDQQGLPLFSNFEEDQNQRPTGRIDIESERKSGTTLTLGEEKGIPPEVAAALQTGKGYIIRTSRQFDNQEVAFVARAFDYKGQRVVLRVAFPYRDIARLTRDLGAMFIAFSIGLLLLFSLISWFILHHLTRPIKEITEAIRPFQLGQTEQLPKIKLSRTNGEFSRLADTLNALSQRIERQIADLTAEKNERSAILESLGEGVIAVDQEMKVIYMNRTAEVFLGQSLVGKPFSAAKQPHCEELIREAQDKNEVIVRVLKPQPKQKRYLDAVAVPRPETKGAILVLQDKTGSHKLLELGRDFIANASHELKTPLAIIRGFAETLHDHPELSQEMRFDITGKMVSNCQRMDTLIRNLLTLATLDEGLPMSRLQECDLINLVEQAKQTVLTIHPTANIRIKTVGKGPFELLVDSDLFLQALINLIDNAAKYSKPPAEIDVELERRSKDFKIRIADKGIGIPPESVDRIFERFYAVDKSRSRSLGGSGLGLSIVERIVEKHRGEINLESAVGKGTTFTITLPILELREE